MSHVTIACLGIVAGLHGALYGAYKDSPHESFVWRRFAREIVFALAAAIAIPAVLSATSSQGFSWIKFFKSPTFGAVGGLIASGHTTDPTAC